MSHQKRMSASRARQVLSYDKETGKLFWKYRHRSDFQSDAVHKKWNSQHAGKEAGCDGSTRDGWRYRKVLFQRVTYSAHRLAWAIETGEWPEKQIDHIDRNPLNNKWDNLRLSTSFENMNNRGLQSNNKSGVAGVSWCNIRSMWRARPMINGKRFDLGYFSDLDVAAM